MSTQVEQAEASNPRSYRRFALAGAGCVALAALTVLNAPKANDRDVVRQLHEISFPGKVNAVQKHEVSDVTLAAEVELQSSNTTVAVKLGECVSAKVIRKGDVWHQLTSVFNVENGDVVYGNFRYIDESREIVNCKTATVGSVEAPAENISDQVHDTIRSLNIFASPPETNITFHA